jgi:hypothetical protein
MNLVPEKPGASPNYWCTWNAQHPMWYIRTDEEYARFNYLTATEGGNAARRFMNERAVFEDPGWAERFWPRIRSDLYFCFDDGWDVPAEVDSGREQWRFGSLILNEERFPSFGGNPAKRLSRLNARLKELGWRGAALWVASQCEGDGRDGLMADDRAVAAYWRTRARWSAEAGIHYWKVDWGKRARIPSFRRTLTAIGREEAPGLVIEHARCMEPLNNITGNGRFEDWEGVFQQSLDILKFSDVFRSYDEIQELRIPIALDRIAAWGKQARIDPPATGIINCEDNLYMGASLGCSVGIMRVPVRNPWTQWKWPEIDEAVRTVRWQRTAPAFGLSAADFHASSTQLTDSQTVSAQHWFREAAGRLVEQHAPAVISRGIPLPFVPSSGELPYVVASRNPNGAVAIGALPRCIGGVPLMPLAEVVVEAGEPLSPIGIFGRFKTLTFRFPSPISPTRVWAQDLLADEAVDITRRVIIRGNSIVLEGKLIEAIGLACATADDASLPGLVMKLEE